MITSYPRYVLLLVACAFSAAFSSTVTAQTLVGLWRFDGSGSSQSDASGNGNTATAAGDAAWMNDTTSIASTAFDGSNGVFSFDGSGDYFQVTHSTSLALAGDLTLSAWVNASIAHTSGNGLALLSKVNASNTTASFQWAFTSFGHDLYRGNGSVSAHAFDGDTPTIETWTHWAVTMSGTSVTFYKDGTNVGTSTLSTTLGDTGHPLYIGRRPGLGDTFNGLLDDVAIFNGVLSQAEIQTIRSGDFSAFTAVPEPSTYALWIGLASTAAFVVRRRRKLVAQ
jgi:hypothetical protein